MSMIWITIRCETLCIALRADLVAYHDVLVYVDQMNMKIPFLLTVCHLIRAYAYI